MSVPPCAASHVRDDVTFLPLLLQLQYSWNNTLLSKAGIAPLLADIMTALQSKVNGHEQTASLLLYSGHDTTLMPLLFALGAWDGLWPHYASVAIFELLSTPTPGGYAVRFVYNYKAVQLPGCSSVLCPWTEFQDVVGPIVALADQCTLGPGEGSAAEVNLRDWSAITDPTHRMPLRTD